MNVQTYKVRAIFEEFIYNVIKYQGISFCFHVKQRTQIALFSCATRTRMSLRGSAPPPARNKSIVEFGNTGTILRHYRHVRPAGGAKLRGRHANGGLISGAQAGGEGCARSIGGRGDVLEAGGGRGQAGGRRGPG